MGREFLLKYHPIDLPCPSSLIFENISVHDHPKSKLDSRCPVPLEGRIAIVTGRGMGCGGRNRRFDECAGLADGEVVWS
jgi:hypothetical protein